MIERQQRHESADRAQESFDPQKALVFINYKVYNKYQFILLNNETFFQKNDTIQTDGMQIIM